MIFYIHLVLPPGTVGHNDNDLPPEDADEQDDQHQEDVNNPQRDDLRGNFL